MTDRGAQLLRRGRRSAKSSREAWRDIKDRNADTDWDPEAMIAEREGHVDAATSGSAVLSAIRYVGGENPSETCR